MGREQVSGITSRVGNALRFYPAGKIVAFVARDKYVEIHADGIPMGLTATSLISLEKTFTHMIRAHRNAVIAPKYLTAVAFIPEEGQLKPKNHQPPLYAKVGGLTLEVSRRNRAAVKQALRAKAGVVMEKEHPSRITYGRTTQFVEKNDVRAAKDSIPKPVMVKTKKSLDDLKAERELRAILKKLNPWSDL